MYAGLATYRDEKKISAWPIRQALKLYCVNAITGKLISTFGNNAGIGISRMDLSAMFPNFGVSCTTPGIICKDMLIVIAVVEEAAAAPGYIRAYDVHSGCVGSFHTYSAAGVNGCDSWDDKDAWSHRALIHGLLALPSMKIKVFYLAPVGSASIVMILWR